MSPDASFCGKLRRSSWLLVLVFAGACSESESAPEDARRALLRGLGEEIFLPTYAELESKIALLDESVGVLCDEPGGEALDDARDAWWEARAPLKRNELLAFGPYTDEPARYGPKLDFWPARVDTLEDVLSGEEELSADAVNAFGASQKGFPAIEYLLFDPETEHETALADEPRRCEYLSALVADLGAKARGLREAWDPAAGNYLDELVYAGRGSKAFRTLDIAFGEIVNRLVFTVENVRGDKLGAPAGTRSDGKPQPESAESRFSGRSLEDARDNLRGVEAVCLGVTRDAAAASLASQLSRIGRADLVELLEAAFAGSYAALDAIPEPLTKTVVDDPAPVLAAIDELSNLQRLLQVDVIHALGLTLTFNDNDGD
jgi:predicted lipoprotein